MADAPSGSTPAPKAIGSLAKKQSDVTRQGTNKFKFVPTLPQRRKKEAREAKPEPTSAAIPTAPTEGGRGRGRGRGAGRGFDGPERGRGRGAPPAVMMTASGPFAMGPALAGSGGSRRATPRSNFAPSVASTASGSSVLGAGLSQMAAPSLRKDIDLKGKGKVPQKAEDEGEVYSDPDEGVEIIDMERVRDMDWMAPDSLLKQKSRPKIKKETKPTVLDGEIQVGPQNILNSEDEQEPELEDVIEDFAMQVNVDSDPSLREDRLYLFQFPSPFPTFLPDSKPRGEDVEMTDATKKVSFGPDVKPPALATSRTESTVPSEPLKPEALDGLIGRLDVYRNGAVKLRLGDGIVLDLNPATQPSFLQQAVYVDKKAKQLIVLGEVNKQFVASPDIDVLLQALEEADQHPGGPVIEGEEKLIKM